ncbi:hypothetical protein ACTXG7_21775 [Mycolicibacterium sp. Dal123E01]|uniref:hypothetical protein n=1 Tax=Mycolicibacterium sp. Dal123E01 TaxID=3457578 RepID=UPI00403E68E0
MKLSADSTASSAALDRAVLEMLARDSAQSSPTDIFKRSIAGAVTNLTVLSGRAVEQATVLRPVVAGTPQRVPPPRPPVPPQAVADLLSGKPVNVAAAKAPVAPIIDPALQQAVTSVADYVGYVSVQAVEATDEAGAIAAAGPKHIAETLAALTHGDVDTAITRALRSVAAPLAPPSTVVKAIRSEVRKQLTELADRVRRALPPPPRIGQITQPTTVERSTSLQATLGHRRGSVVTTKPKTAAGSKAQDEPDVTKAPAVNGATDMTDGNKATDMTDGNKATDMTDGNKATDVTDGNKAVPNKKAPAPRLRQRVETSLNKARSSLDRLGDALRKAVTPPKPPRAHRAHRG